jgi:uncharacterized protein YifN (PemK superfamily)
MAIQHVPDAGDVLMCDFTGFQAPEMTKVRRVVVLSPRSRVFLKGTYLVVPISKTPPGTVEAHHCEFKPRAYDFFDMIESVWAKTDMATCVGYHRLDRVKINGRYTGARIRASDLLRIKASLLHALGMETWKQVEIAVRATVLPVLTGADKSVMLADVTPR